MPDVPDDCRQCPLIAPHLRDYKVAYRRFQTDKLSRETMANDHVNPDLYDAALSKSEKRLEAAYDKLDSERARTVGCVGLGASDILEPALFYCQSPFKD